MAMSSQRLIVMILLLDIVLGSIMIFASSTSEDYLKEQVNGSIKMYNNWSDNFDSRFRTETDDENRQILNPTAGDAKSSGLSVYEILSKGIDIKEFGNCLNENCTFTYIYYIISGVYLFMALVNVLLIYEIYLVFFNKKVT